MCPLQPVASCGPQWHRAKALLRLLMRPNPAKKMGPSYLPVPMRPQPALQMRHQLPHPLRLAPGIAVARMTRVVVAWRWVRLLAVVPGTAATLAAAG